MAPGSDDVYDGGGSSGTWPNTFASLICGKAPHCHALFFCSMHDDNLVWQLSNTFASLWLGKHMDYDRTWPFTRHIMTPCYTFGQPTSYYTLFFLHIVKQDNFFYKL